MEKSFLFVFQLFIFQEIASLPDMDDTPPPNVPKATAPDADKTITRARSTLRRYTYVYGGVNDTCDWDALTCMRVYKTGLVCARSMYFVYNNFNNACEMDFVNCKLGIETWMVVHMGVCINNNEIMSSLILSTDKDDETFLDRNYAISDMDFG